MIYKAVFECMGCGKAFTALFEEGVQSVCPDCKSANINLVRKEELGDSQTKGKHCGCGCSH